jgi:DNA polymerase I-like protein with 3'-5' exonuclease and polymerase domains/uracil-DNA glycosylase
MAFFHNAAKVEARRKPAASSRPRGDIPIASLNKLGCSVCPKDKDHSLNTPKMEPQGDDRPLIYVLQAAPTRRDDEKGQWASDAAGRALLRALPREAGDSIRFGGITQCATDTVVVGKHESECCRSRVEQDIERTKPKVILGVGDAPLAWATKLDAYAPRFRGRFIAVKVGSHRCWYYCVNYPNWVFSNNDRKGPSPHEVVFKHDLAELWNAIHDLDEPDIHEGGYDKGVTVITGEEGSEDIKRLERHLERLLLPERVGLDIETNGLRPWKLADPRLLTAAVGTFEDTVAFPLDFPEAVWSGGNFEWGKAWADKQSHRKAWSLFVDYVAQSGIKECHNLAMELEWLAYLMGDRITRITEWDDTMSMAHTIDKRPGSKALGVQTKLYYGFDLKALSDLDAARIAEYPVKRVLLYNGMDTKWTNYHSRTLRPIIARDRKLQWSHDRKVRLASTLVITEAVGLPVDLEYAEEIDTRLEKTARAIEARIQNTPEVKKYVKAKGTFSPTNPDHVLALMQMLGREEVLKDTSDGLKNTTDADALSSIPASEVPSAPLILEHRGIEKIQSTYIRPLTSRRLISPDGKIHAKYSSMTAVTDRLAAEDPNAQNWPKRKFREVRGVVRARKGRWLLACDYGQIEFRVAGMASGDDNLVRYCWTGYDVHMHWAQRFVDVYPEIKDIIVEEFEVDWDEKGMKTLRQEVKNKWVFPSIFGAVTRSRAQNMHVPLDVADNLDREFWDEFPGVRRWQQKLIKSYERCLYVETLGGNRRYGPMSTNEIINMPIQGTAAEIVTEAMVALSERALVEDRVEDRHPILNVHDDLTFEPSDADLEETIAVVTHEMCQHRFDFINVPLVVEVSVGERWSELKEIGVYRSDVLFNLPNPYKE